MKNKIIFKAPENITVRDRSMGTVFLAGSIEMGKAENWQEKVTKVFNDLGYIVFNPRRDDWDSTWTQEFSNSQFYQQVNWELNSLETADIIVMYFDPNTMSPISLLELGLFANSGKLKVICPDGFWRKGNVEITCDYYDVPLFHTLEDFLNHLK